MLDFRKDRDRELEARLLQDMLADCGADDNDDDKDDGGDKNEYRESDEDCFKPIQELSAWKAFKESQAEDDLRIKKFQKTMSITRKVNKFVTRQSAKFNRANLQNARGEDGAGENNFEGCEIVETDNESLMGSQVEGSVLDVLDDDFKADLLQLREIKYPVFTDNQIETMKQAVKEELEARDLPEMDFELKYESQQRELRTLKRDSGTGMPSEPLQNEYANQKEGNLR